MAYVSRMRSASFLLATLLLSSNVFAQEAVAPEATPAGEPDGKATTEAATDPRIPPPLPVVRARDSEEPQKGVSLRPASHDPAVEEGLPRNERFGSRAGTLIEFSTAGFASSELSGGVFVGRQDRGYSFGVSLDYSRLEVGDNSVKTASTRGSLLAGGRFRVAQTANQRVECIIGAEAGLGWASNKGLGDFRVADSENSASGLVVAAGPGLRIWVVDGLALGYQTRLRYTSLKGDGAVASNEDFFSDSSNSITASSLGIDGRFSIFGVF